MITDGEPATQKMGQIRLLESHNTYEASVYEANGTLLHGATFKSLRVALEWLLEQGVVFVAIKR